MEERRTVVLYGKSLLMAAMEASLRDQPGLDVVRIDATLPNAVQRLSALRPDVVIFDLTAPPSNFQLPTSNLQPPFSILHSPGAPRHCADRP